MRSAALFENDNPETRYTYDTYHLFMAHHHPPCTQGGGLLPKIVP